MVGFMKSALNLLGIKKDGDVPAVGLEDFLQTLPGLMGYDIRFKKEEREGRPHYELEGSDVESLLADCPNILEAFSHISMRIVRKGEGASNTPQTEGEGMGAFFVSFDAGGFRDRKNVELRELAANQRQKVIDAGGKPAYISALSPAERKVIHTHLLELGDVVSESIGKGNFKRIRVRLKDDSPHRRARPQGQGHSNGGGGGERGERGNSNRRGGRGGRNRNGGGAGKNFGGPNHNNNRGPSGSPGSEVNGNRVAVDNDSDVDDNIGNRLKPGEENPFYSTAFGSSDSNRN